MVFPIENGPHFQSTASPASLLDLSMASLGPARLPHELPLKVKDGVPLRRGCDLSGGSCWLWASEDSPMGRLESQGATNIELSKHMISHDT